MKKEIITPVLAGLALITSVTALVARPDGSEENTLFATYTPAAAATPAGDARFISQQDFINASEQTVNGVVSVKSFATPQGRHPL